MRISVLKEDPGYHKCAHLCIPYFNGEKLPDCITADEERGEVWVMKRDENGNHIINKEEDMVEIEILKGEVKIKIPAKYRILF